MHATARTRDDDARAGVLLSARADGCKLLSACFYPPDRRLLAETDIIGDLANRLAIACPVAVRHVPALPDPMDQEAFVALAVAYTRLFTGPPSIMAPPHASFYLDGKSSVMGPSAVSMMKHYREMGLRLDDGFPEMPDHIAVVLEFLYFLLFEEAMLSERGAAEERIERADARIVFLDRYARPWIPRFCRRIATADRHPFYNGLARCLELFVERGLDTAPIETE